MRKHIIILISLFIFQSNYLLCQDTIFIKEYEPTIRPVFESYDFNNGSYTIYVTHWSDRVDSLANSLGIFYIQDIAALNTIKDEWKFLESMNSYDCGYDFVFHICKKDEVKEVLRLNLYCNSLISNNGHAFEFDKNKLFLLKNKSDTLEKHIFNYPTRQQALTSLDSLLVDSSNFVPKKTHLDWYSSEGHFMFKYSFDPKSKPDLDTLLDNLEAEIQSTYPKEIFKIENCGYSPWGNYSFRVYSSSVLFHKFDLYETILDFNKYDNFQIEVYKKTTYNKK